MQANGGENVDPSAQKNVPFILQPILAYDSDCCLAPTITGQSLRHSYPLIPVMVTGKLSPKPNERRGAPSTDQLSITAITHGHLHTH